jgi:hypothetical protein
MEIPGQDQPESNSISETSIHVDRHVCQDQLINTCTFLLQQSWPFAIRGAKTIQDLVRQRKRAPCSLELFFSQRTIFFSHNKSA